MSLDLSLVSRFYAGVAVIVAIWIVLFAAWAWLPSLLRASLAWCRRAFPPQTPNVVDLAEWRLRTERR